MLKFVCKRDKKWDTGRKGYHSTVKSFNPGSSSCDPILLKQGEVWTIIANYSKYSGTVLIYNKEKNHTIYIIISMFNAMFDERVVAASQIWRGLAVTEC